MNNLKDSEFAENLAEIIENEEESHKEELKQNGFYEAAVEEAENKAEAEEAENKAEAEEASKEEKMFENKTASEVIDGLYKKADRVYMKINGENKWVDTIDDVNWKELTPEESKAWQDSTERVKQMKEERWNSFSNKAKRGAKAVVDTGKDLGHRLSPSAAALAITTGALTAPIAACAISKNYNKHQRNKLKEERKAFKKEKREFEKAKKVASEMIDEMYKEAK